MPPMNSATKLPFNVKIPVVEHDQRLVRRYLLQSVLRMAGCGLLLMTVLIYLPLLAALWHHAKLAALLRGGSQLSTVLFMCNPILISMLSAWGIARRKLDDLRGAGVALTPELMSSQPERWLDSPLDHLSTFDLCAETLSGLGIGVALGYHAPAVFSYQPFQGRIVLGPWRPLWLGRSIVVEICGDAGEPVRIHIRRRAGMDFFLVQNGAAWRAVDTVAAHLREQLDRRAHALKAAQRERELERSALHAKLSALQAQVEPHFLFNTLANLKYLIRTDADAAQQMLDHLVGYLQNALPDMRSVSSTLGRELALARAYLSIMQIRMGQRLRFQIDADDSLLALPFPPAMLISLVENAVKHGLERASRPGEIAIHAERRGTSLCVLVRDDGSGLSDQMGTGFGLANIHERLQLLYGERASLSVTSAQSGGVDALLAIPVSIKE